MKASGATADLSDMSSSGVGDLGAWFGKDGQGNITCLDSQQVPIISLPISNTGDLAGSNPSIRIQIGKSGDISSPAIVLSVDGNGNVICELWDRLSTQQVWSYLDWAKGMNPKLSAPPILINRT
jgi:hypothetical protein